MKTDGMVEMKVLNSPEIFRWLFGLYFCFVLSNLLYEPKWFFIAVFMFEVFHCIKCSFFSSERDEMEFLCLEDLS